MVHRRSRLPFLLAAAIGAVLWWAAAFISGRREPWDGAGYWAVAYPLSILACAFLGYSHPQRSWGLALLLFEAQFFAMCVRNGELGNLWPLGMVLFAIVALPGVFAAMLTARLKRRSRGAADEQASRPS
jgi:hypothetical protein